MSKKLYGGLLPLLAIAAFLGTAAAAQAAPHWYSEGTKLAENKPLKVSTFGVLSLTNAKVGTVTCTVLDNGTITNPTGGGAGVGEILVFNNYECAAEPACPGVTIAAESLPWKIELSEPVSGTFRAKIKGIKIKLTCPSPVVSETFTGELTPKFNLGTHVSNFEFGTGSGELTSTNLGNATVSGKDNVAGTLAGELINVKNP